mmetsp:Transcript_25687/g.45006  ORF Transcript_25687/g.45006 Transcript_25687/m.45006 type:complete len:441 (-) Transcript_25687:91-1413(-)
MELGHKRSSHPSFKSHCKALERAFSKLTPAERKDFRQRNLQEFLSVLNKGEFDPYLVRELMKRLEVSDFAVLDINRVIETYVDMELEVVERIEALRLKNDEISQTAAKYKRHEIQARGNASSLDVKSRTVFVDIKRVKHIVSATGKASPVVELSFEGQKANTKVVQGNVNPEFNEQFEFRVSKGTEPVKLEVYDYATKELKGYSIVSVSGQMNGQYNNHTTNLMSNTGSVVDTLIEYSVVVADNKVQLYEVLYNSYQRESETCRSDIDRYSDQLMKFQSPFGLSFENSFINYSRDEFKQIDDIVTGRLDNFIKGSLGKEIEIEKVLMIAIALFALFSALVMFARPDFFGVILSATCLLLLARGSASSTQFKNLAILVAVSEVYDLVWTLLVGFAWLKGTYENDLEDGLRRFSLIMSGLNFIFKIVLFILLWRKAVILKAT